MCNKLIEYQGRMGQSEGVHRGAEMERCVNEVYIDPSLVAYNKMQKTFAERDHLGELLDYLEPLKGT